MFHITLEDIARLVGLSTSTVSRALNNKPDVHPRTREKVIRVAERLGYTPNSIARSLKYKKTKTIGVIIADISNPFFAAVVAGIEDEVRKKNYNIILCSSNEEYEREEEAIMVLLRQRVDGLLITPTQRESKDILHIKSLTVPFVLIGRHFSSIETNYVITDDVLGGFLATDHLLERGHRKILFINAPLHISSAKERLEGYKQALLKYGVEFDEKLVKIAPNAKMIDAYKIAKKVLSQKLDFTAVFTFSDFLAIGVIKALYENGLKVPRDIAIVGYDDIEFSSALEVPLTTVRQPKYELGKEATNILIEKILKGKSNRVYKRVVKPELIIRSSS